MRWSPARTVPPAVRRYSPSGDEPASPTASSPRSPESPPGRATAYTTSAPAAPAIRQRIPGSTGPSITQGVSVKVGEQQAAIDLDVVIDYGVPIVDLAGGIRRNVIGAVERMTGLQVTEVNIAVDDIYIDSEEDSDQQQTPPRVQ